MSEHDQEPSAAPSPARSRLPGWGRLLAVVSVVLMGAGVAIPFVAGPEPAPGGVSGEKSLAGPGVTGLTSEGSAGGVPPEGAAASGGGGAGWGPWVFRLGFSFFVGFSISFALRSFMKFAVVALGFFFLALFGLQYAGIIEVRWALLVERYDELSGEIQARASGIWGSMSAVLPSAASATAGLVAGFWRRSL